MLCCHQSPSPLPPSSAALDKRCSLSPRVPVCGYTDPIQGAVKSHEAPSTAPGMHVGKPHQCHLWASPTSPWGTQHRGWGMPRALEPMGLPEFQRGRERKFLSAGGFPSWVVPWRGCGSLRVPSPSPPPHCGFPPASQRADKVLSCWPSLARQPPPSSASPPLPWKERLQVATRNFPGFSLSLISSRKMEAFC